MTSSGRNGAAIAAITALLILGACSKSDTPTASTTSGNTGTTTAVAGPTYGPNDTTISAKVGSTFNIKLESNASTGYRWTYTAEGNNVKLLGQKDENPGGIGTSGSQTFTFEATSAGTTSLAFTYARSTPAPDDKHITYKVTVT